MPMKKAIVYENRQEAGMILASHLTPHITRETVILSLPRGGTIVAGEITQLFDLPHGLIIVRKIGAPFDPEIAIGAVTPDGQFIANERYIEALAIPQDYIENQKALEYQEIQRRLSLFQQNSVFPEIQGKSLIVVDDGIATGYTMEAALRWLKTYHPKEICLAAPVGSREALNRLRHWTDLMICPYIPDPFTAVGHYYRTFEPVSDTAVQSALATSMHTTKSR